MTIDTCALLLDGWILGTVPAGIVCDALIDLGVDPDVQGAADPWYSVREGLETSDRAGKRHGYKGMRAARAESIRRLLRRELLATPSNHQEQIH